MKRRAFVLASGLAGLCALAFVQCSLIEDTSGLSGGDDPDAEGGANGREASPFDAPSGDGFVRTEAGSNALGETWLAYGSTTGVIGVRPWDVTTGAWDVEQAGPSVNGALVRWVVPKETPSGSFLAVVSTNNTGSNLDVFERNTDGTWKSSFTVPVPAPTRRGFDIEYELTTKAVIVVYADATPIPKMRRRTATGWSTEQSLPGLESNRPAWIELARNPIANEIGLVYVDEAVNLVGSTWNGTTWSTPIELDSHINTVDFKCFDAAYENQSGKLLATWGHWSTEDGGDVIEQRYATRPFGGTFSSVSSLNAGTPPGPLVLAPEIGSNRIANAYLEYNCNKNDMPCDDFNTGIWDGTSFTSTTNLDPNTTTLYHGRPASMPVGIGWLGGSGTAVTAFHRALATGGDQLPFSVFSDLKWDPVAGAFAPPALPPRSSMQLSPAPGPTVVATILDTAGGLWAKGYRLSGATAIWGDVAGGKSLAKGLLVSGGVPFGATTGY